MREVRVAGVNVASACRLWLVVVLRVDITTPVSTSHVFGVDFSVDNMIDSDYREREKTITGAWQASFSRMRQGVDVSVYVCMYAHEPVSCASVCWYSPRQD